MECQLRWHSNIRLELNFSTGYKQPTMNGIASLFSFYQYSTVGWPLTQFLRYSGVPTRIRKRPCVSLPKLRGGRSKCRCFSSLTVHVPYSLSTVRQENERLMHGVLPGGILNRTQSWEGSRWRRGTRRGHGWTVPGHPPRHRHLRRPTNKTPWSQNRCLTEKPGLRHRPLRKITRLLAYQHTQNWLVEVARAGGSHRPLRNLTRLTQCPQHWLNETTRAGGIPPQRMRTLINTRRRRRRLSTMRVMRTGMMKQWVLQ